MSTFKSKPVKKNNNKKNNSYRVTLDVVYNKKVNYFDRRKQALPQKKKELIKYKNELESLTNKHPSNYTTKDIRTKSQLKTNIANLENDIYNIDKNIDEMDFFEKAYDILDSYYDILENKVPIKSEQESEKKKPDLTIIDFFKQRQRKKIQVKPKEKKDDRATLCDKFLQVTENVSRNKDYIFVQSCPTCNQEMILHHSDGRYSCTTCGISQEIIIDSDKPNYKDPIPDKKAYAYKRMNHFSEWLSQVQGRESTHIPDEVYDKILQELHKIRFKQLSKLTHTKIKQILKKLGLNKYYEHTTHIINKLNGVPPPNIPRDVEERLKLMFRQIQEPFLIYKPAGRKNFLSYSYVLHKFCQLLGHDQYLRYFKLLKSINKLREQDKLWCKVCGHLKWEYIASI
jgi:ribosomal protein S27AE